MGGVAPVQNDYGAVGMDSTTGKASLAGDIKAIDTLASFGRTVLGAVGTDAVVIDAAITGGKIVTGALA
jgi:hypothetical protein